MSATRSQDRHRTTGARARIRRDRVLLERYRDDRDPRTRDEIVERFLPLARSVAQRFAHRSEPMDDLQQVAVIGLIKAIDRFDPSQNTAFSTFAVPTISGELKRYFRDRTWSVRPPRDLLERSLRVQSAVGRLIDQLHRQPTVPEIVEHLGGVSDEEVLDALQAAQAHDATSLQGPRGHDPDAPALEDAIGGPDEEYERAEERATVGVLMRSIGERERDVLRMRFDEDMTQAEIGAAIGVSQMQISRIIRQALGRLRIAAESR